MRTLRLTIVLGLLSAPLVRGDTTPTAVEIVKAAIAKQERDRNHCVKFTTLSTTTKIKYDKKMQPQERTITMRKAYFWGEKTSEEILSIEEEGKPLAPAEIEKRVVELNKEWIEQQKDKEKKEGSKDNFVDPLTVEGMPVYDFYLIGGGDSTFAVIPSAIATVAADPVNNGVIDQTVEKLMSYYVVMARSKSEDSRHLNATYWIDSRNYGLLKMTFNPAKLPRFVEMLDFQMDYQVVRDDDSLLYLPRRFELKGKAGFLFFKGRFGVIEEYSAYRCDNSLSESLFDKRYSYKGGAK